MVKVVYRNKGLHTIYQSKLRLNKQLDQSSVTLYSQVITFCTKYRRDMWSSQWVRSYQSNYIQQIYLMRLVHQLLIVCLKWILFSWLWWSVLVLELLINHYLKYTTRIPFRQSFLYLMVLFFGSSLTLLSKKIGFSLFFLVENCLLTFILNQNQTL